MIVMENCTNLSRVLVFYRIVTLTSKFTRSYNQSKLTFKMQLILKSTYFQLMSIKYLTCSYSLIKMAKN